ncbi:D-amino-acid oxidase [Streptomyces sp. V3I8]|uniref:FAD-dependent oxidoreductase n=1 Tax=Streptomyces sp. V3I8 TaxID=3042279 RepID=UPI002786FDD4|nr:FAD-dependent oxidoreductase [Streptomyces sp. V3I8]MDQ1034912.1 D-amino-acid oxidase [Streptomyces sp. V3I8]
MAEDRSGDVIVVGSGVIGLTTAFVLAGSGRRVRIWTREPAERTTSAVAGALWWPYAVEPQDLARAWALHSLSVYEELAERPDETGVRMVEGVMGGALLDEQGAWAAARLPGLRASTAQEYAGPGLWARLPLIDMPVHLGWLRTRFLRAGGVVEARTVTDLAEARAEAGTVVNCTGIGARELVGDAAVRAVRGQLVVVENPGVRTWVVSTDAVAGTTTYLFPQPGGLVLGGTTEADSWSLTADPSVAAGIVERCAVLRPEVAGARVIGHRVGLRPVRSAVRLERDASAGGAGGGVLVHNYGHGGAGVTVAWGCAEVVLGLVP